VGNQIEMVDRNGRKTTFNFDNLNRRTAENWIDVSGQSVRSTTYTYDAVGNTITVTDPDVRYTYGYDALNRLSTLDNTGTSGIPSVVLDYLYDEAGRLVTVKDRINGTDAGQTSYIYDMLNWVTQITQAGTGVQSKRVNMAYNAVNQMIGLRRFSELDGLNSVAETGYVYDQKQRLTQLAHKKGSANLASYDYTFDAADKLTKIVSSVDGTVDYSYDATNQLTGANHSGQTDEAYQYDANGNRTNSGYQTGTNNQMLSDGQFSYEYDKEGNRTKRTEMATGKVTEYVWDYRNRLAGVLFKDAAGTITKSVEYVYDLNNLRIGKKIDGVVTERYAIDRNQIALVFNGQGQQTHRYLYGTQVDQVLAEESGNQTRWLLADHQGTVKDVVDGSGAIVDHVTYDSFGRIIGQTGNIDLRFAYTGREWDGETGQYYYRARYYDAAVGRFISEDPIGFNSGDTNINRYVRNEVVYLKDPSGLMPLNREDNDSPLVTPDYTPVERDLITSAERSYANPLTEEWDDGKFLAWQSGLLNINDFKNQWVCGYKNVINDAANKYNIPPQLLAAIAWREVGGKPLIADHGAHALRSLTSNRLANGTSFGDLSIQISTAAEALGYDPGKITYSQSISILYALKSPRINIFIAAKHLSDLRDRYLPKTKKNPSSITGEQLEDLAGAYNRGAVYRNLEDFRTHNFSQYGVSAFRGLKQCGCY
jgi:RHS repeat-associated protein